MNKVLHLFATLALFSAVTTAQAQTNTDFATYGDFTFNFDCTNVPSDKVYTVVNYKKKEATVNSVTYPFTTDVANLYIAANFDGLQFGASNATAPLSYNNVIFTKPFAGMTDVKVTMRGNYEGGHLIAGYTTDNNSYKARFYYGSANDVSPLAETMTEYDLHVPSNGKATGNLMFKMASSQNNFYIRIQKIVVNCEVAAVPDYGYTVAYSNHSVDYSASGLKAYALTLNGTTLSATPVTGVVAAKTPVLVCPSTSITTAANYPLITSLTDDGSDVETSLRMSDGTVTGDGSTIYTLDNGTEGIGFYRVAQGTAIEKGKAYIYADGAGDFIALPESTGVKPRTATDFATYGDFTLNFDCTNVPSEKVYTVVNYKKKEATVNSVTYPFTTDVAFLYIAGGFDGLQFGASNATAPLNYNNVIFTKPFAGMTDVKVTMRGNYAGGHFIAGYTTDNNSYKARFYYGSANDVSPLAETMTEYDLHVPSNGKATGNLMFKMASSQNNFYIRIQKIVVNCEVAAIPDYGYTVAYSNHPVDYAASGLTAYALTLNGTTLSASPVTGVVAAKTPVLVRPNTKITAATNYPLITSLTDEGSDVTTSLKMSDGTIKGDGSSIYALDSRAQGVGFYRVDQGTAIEKGKAYIYADGAGDYIALPETTGISMTKYDKVNSNAAYNLAGQRVNDSYKGVVIRNGKKYINK